MVLLLGVDSPENSNLVASAFVIPQHRTKRHVSSSQHRHISIPRTFLGESASRTSPIPIPSFFEDEEVLLPRPFRIQKLDKDRETNLLSDKEETLLQSSPEGKPPNNPVCRVVTRCDSKLPTSLSSLPRALTRQRPPYLLQKLDDIFHLLAHDETRRLKYMNDAAAKAAALHPEEEQELVATVRRSLEDAGYQLLSRRDLELCEALNAGYLLRLSILPDLSELDPNLAREFYPERFLTTSKNGKAQAKGNHDTTADELLFDGRVLVFWRGYSQEISKGRLLLPKIDYLQASIVQRSAAWLRARLNILETHLTERTIRLCTHAVQATRSLIFEVIHRLPHKSLANNLQAALNSSSLRDHEAVHALMNAPPGKLFKLARYGGSKIRFVGSPNPTDALNPFMICEEAYAPSGSNRVNGTFPSDEDVERDMYTFLNDGNIQCPHDEELAGKDSAAATFRIPLRKRQPPMQLLKRVSLSSLVDFFSKEGRRHLLSTIFGKSELVEPTYEEVVVVWRPKPKPDVEPTITLPNLVYDLADMFDFKLPERPPPSPRENTKPLEIRAFSGVPMANLPAVLPKTKLVFRPADAFVFDFVSLISFVLVIGSQKFDNPKLDILALVSVSLWIIRTVLRYSNKLARYDLLVKKFLTSKISHRNRGALKYIAGEAGTQRAIRAALVHEWLASESLNDKSSMKRADLVEVGETNVNRLLDDFKRIPININAALNDLEDLNLVSTDPDGHLSVVRDPKSILANLKGVWMEVFHGRINRNIVAGTLRKRP